ncbi:MAG TPA: arginase [Alphaproteobacteria bacterium]|nr:arginase [Alphaproteobacteria bacterium]
MTSKPTIELIGAPTDIGAADRGSSMGPEALRVAGLDLMLRKMGLSVLDAGNVSGPPNPDAAVRDGYRHLEETTEWCRNLQAAVAASLAAGRLPLVMGGDHSIAIGSIAAVAEHCAASGMPLTVVWLDAHADFNTPQTSPSGNIHGMPVAILCGEGPPALAGLGRGAPILAPDDLVLLGVRSVDHVEKAAVLKADLTVYDMRAIDERRMRDVMDEVASHVTARGGHLHLSFDVDFLDPTIAPGVGTTVKGGPTYRESQLCMEMLFETGLLGSMEITELNPALDLRNQTAELVVELVASLFGEQILSRHQTAFD